MGFNELSYLEYITYDTIYQDYVEIPVIGSGYVHFYEDYSFLQLVCDSLTSYPPVCDSIDYDIGSKDLIINGTWDFTQGIAFRPNPAELLIAGKCSLLISESPYDPHIGNSIISDFGIQCEDYTSSVTRYDLYINLPLFVEDLLQLSFSFKQ
jgi:hypothetical protein